MSPCHLQSLISSPPLVSPPPPLILAPPGQTSFYPSFSSSSYPLLSQLSFFSSSPLPYINTIRLWCYPSLVFLLNTSLFLRLLVLVLPVVFFLFFLFAPPRHLPTRVRTIFEGFSRTLFSAKKEPWVYVFLVVRQHEKFYPEGLSVFAPLGTWESGLNKVSTEIRGLSSTDCNFQGLSRCVRSGTLSSSHVCPLHLFLASTFPYYSSLLCYPEHI